MVGLVEPCDELHFPGAADHHVRLELADLPRDVASQVEGVDQHPVGVVEHRQVLHAHRVTGRALLTGPEHTGFLRRTLHPGLPSGQQQVGNLDAGGCPLRDGRRRAVLHVIGVGDNAQDPLEVLIRQQFDRRLGHGSP